MSDKKLIILIAGNAGHGKDTFANFIKPELDKFETCRLDAFAYGIKCVAHQVLGIPWELLNADKSIKESTNCFIGDEDTGVTIRKCLQGIGEFFRKAFGAKVWAYSTVIRAKLAKERITVITDCRQPDEELLWFREACSDFADVISILIRNPRVPVTRGHPSEDLIADAPDELFDLIIKNDGTLDDLKLESHEFAIALKLSAYCRKLLHG